jgi:hypothetical protein
MATGDGPISIFAQPIEFYHGRVPFILSDLLQQLDQLDFSSSPDLFRDVDKPAAYRDLVARLDSARVSDWQPFARVSVLGAALVEYLRTATNAIPLLDGSLLLRDPLFNTTGDIVPLIRKALQGVYAGRHRTLFVVIDFLRNIQTIGRSDLFTIFGSLIFGVSSVSNHRETLFHVFQVLIDRSSDIFKTVVLGPAAYLNDKQVDTLIKRACGSQPPVQARNASPIRRTRNSSAIGGSSSAADMLIDGEAPSRPPPSFPRSSTRIGQVPYDKSPSMRRQETTNDYGSREKLTQSYRGGVGGNDTETNNQKPSGDRTRPLATTGRIQTVRIAQVEKDPPKPTRKVSSERGNKGRISLKLSALSAWSDIDMDRIPLTLSAVSAWSDLDGGHQRKSLPLSSRGSSLLSVSEPSPLSTLEETASSPSIISRSMVLGAKTIMLPSVSHLSDESNSDCPEPPDVVPEPPSDSEGEPWKRPMVGEQRTSKKGLLSRMKGK